MKAANARVLLTGAGGGIGQALAVQLVRAGAELMLAGRSQLRLAAQAQALASESGTPRWVAADLGAEGAAAQLARAAAAWDCNVVIHAAGVASFGPLQALAPEELQRTLHVNLLAPMLLTRLLLPHLQAQPAAAVLFVGSVLGAIGLPGFSAYSASKFGLRGFAQALRRELAGTPVRVQYLGPRSTRTAFNDADVQAYNRATQTASDAPEHVAAALLQMLQDETAERFLGFPEKLGVRINGAWPTALDGSFERHVRSLQSLPSLTQRTEP